LIACKPVPITTSNDVVIQPCHSPSIAFAATGILAVGDNPAGEAGADSLLFPRIALEM
jgi:hypothetical protein